ncbi:MAG: acetyl-CoA C-acyltransferase, partial [Clostridiales bacterium]|nr:acetyl-CoA C-acyltransferase [Clostridiales bacterium]
MQKVFIISGRRTAVGSFLGALSETSVADMGAEVVKAVLNDAKVSPDKVDELICGNILSAGLGQGIGRQISVKAGIP